MTNLQLLHFLDRINVQRKFHYFHDIVLELLASGIRPNMHEELAPDRLSIEQENERLLGRFLCIIEREAYREMAPWLNEAVDLCTLGRESRSGRQRSPQIV